MPEFIAACRAEDLPPGAGRLFQHDGKDIALFNVKGALYAMEDTCLHAGGPLHEGGVLGTMVICPWHHWEFDLRDGSCSLNPHHKLAVYEIREIEGRIEVAV
ncbi:MAG: Rieske (2Fe-2S) protein [Planctomycetota bacterium]